MMSVLFVRRKNKWVMGPSNERVAPSSSLRLFKKSQTNVNKKPQSHQRHFVCKNLGLLCKRTCAAHGRRRDAL